MKGYDVDGKEGWADIIAVKGSEKWVIEVKGDQRCNRGNLLINLIGQIIRDMEDDVTYYAIGIPRILLGYFRSWGVKGLKSLPPIHLLLVDKDGVVEHKTPDEFKSILLQTKSKNTFSIIRPGLRFTRKHEKR